MRPHHAPLPYHEDDIDTPRTPTGFDAKLIESLPDKPVADAIKGGAIRRVRGGDDDLEDLEVER